MLKILVITDLQTTIVLFTRNVSSHKTDRILSESRYSGMNSLEGENLCLLRNLYKCKQVACSVVVACLLDLSAFFLLHFVVACLNFNRPFL